MPLSTSLTFSATLSSFILLPCSPPSPPYKDGKTTEFDLISKSYANLLRKWADL